MKFSVIIPAYNAERHIMKGLDSIRDQSFKDYELIIVCDSCEDKTEMIARKYTDKVIPIFAHNDGVARSTGLDAAQGEFVLFLDDDDWFLHEFVFEMLDDWTNNVKADVYCFGFIWKGIGFATPTSNHGTFYPSVWNKVWRRSFIGETRFPNVYSISDAYFHHEMFTKAGAVVAAWDMPMVYYNYLRPGSISHEMGRTIEGTIGYWENN